MAFPI